MRYFARKSSALLATLFVISLLAFLAFQVVPGDPTVKMLGSEYTPERAEALRETLGLNDHALVRYAKWLGGFVSGDFGMSYSYHMPVASLLTGKMTTTALLSALAFCITVLTSIPGGLVLARHEGGIVDRVMIVVNQIMMSVPPFFIGIIFTSVFGLGLKLFIAGEFISFADSRWGFFRCIVFPALAIALPKSAMTIKLLRSSILAELGEDYVRTAYSRGNSRLQVLQVHVLRNAVMPVITFLAMTLGDIVAGSIIIEQVFTIPGLGRLLLLAIGNRDYPVVLTVVMLISALILTVNFLADVAYQYIDPRVRLQ
ncbi:MAG: ABC transporter permease [Clostridiales bacterium]|nr:ABC transporter permease [Clostridiales bacterium]